MNNIAVIKLHASKKFTNFLEAIDGLEDRRKRSMNCYHLTDLVVIMVFSIIGGANNPSEIEQYCKLHSDWFSDILCLKSITPSHDTFARVLEIINPMELEFWLNEWRTEFEDVLTERHIAFDGKKDRANKKFILRAYDSSSRAVIAHVRIPKEANEISVTPALLNLINMKNAIVTGDAMHAQRKNTSIITKNGGNYLFTIKGNQHAFYNDIKLFLDDLLNNALSGVSFSKAELHERSHGRTEKRTCISTDNIKWLSQRMQWSKLRSISVVESKRIINGLCTVQRRYFISSLPADASCILKLARAHWSIENHCHRHLDVDFRSDWSTLRNDTAVLNLSIIKDFCLYLLSKSDLKGGIKTKRAECAFVFGSLIETLIN